MEFNLDGNDNIISFSGQTYDEDSNLLTAHYFSADSKDYTDMFYITEGETRKVVEFFSGNAQIGKMENFSKSEYEDDPLETEYDEQGRLLRKVHDGYYDEYDYKDDLIRIRSYDDDQYRRYQIVDAETNKLYKVALMNKDGRTENYECYYHYSEKPAEATPQQLYSGVWMIDLPDENLSYFDMFEDLDKAYEDNFALYVNAATGKAKFLTGWGICAAAFNPSDEYELFLWDCSEESSYLDEDFPDMLVRYDPDTDTMSLSTASITLRYHPEDDKFHEDFDGYEEQYVLKRFF